MNKKKAPLKTSSVLINNTQQINLPTQYSLYRELINQIGITSPVQRNLFRFNFKEKYQKHVGILERNEKHQSSFEVSKHQEILQKQERLKQIRKYISQKQQKAIKHRQSNLHEKKKVIHQNNHYWQKRVQKQRKKTLGSLQNSNKLVRKWDQKYETSMEKKKNILNKMSQKSHEHNDYVSMVARNSRQSLSSSTQRSEKRYQISLPSSCKSSVLSRKQKKDEEHRIALMEQKKEIQEEALEKSLQINISKERKIMEARELKKYLLDKKKKGLHERQEQSRKKFSERNKILLQNNEVKKKALEIELKRKRTKNRDISLPIIRNKFDLKNKDESFVYLTETPGQKDNSQKYSKVMMEKLRSISVILQKQKNKIGK